MEIRVVELWKLLVKELHKGVDILCCILRIRDGAGSIRLNLKQVNNRRRIQARDRFTYPTLTGESMKMTFADSVHEYGL